MTQSDSPLEPGTAPDSRSLTDLFREFTAAKAACPVVMFDVDPAGYEAHVSASSRFFQRFEEVAGRCEAAWEARDDAHRHEGWTR